MFYTVSYIYRLKSYKLYLHTE